MELACKTKLYESKLSSCLGILVVLVRLSIAVTRTPRPKVTWEGNSFLHLHSHLTIHHLRKPGQGLSRQKSGGWS